MGSSSITNPMGYAEAGLSTFSKYTVQEAKRFQLPGMEPWPKRLFDLDRAIVEHTILLIMESMLDS